MGKTIKIYWIGILFTFLGVAGCKLTESYQQPEINAPSSFYGTDSTAVGDSAIKVKSHWEDFFVDSTLKALIDTALENNIDLQIAQAYVDIANARFKQSKAASLPSLEVVPFKARKDLFSENYNNFGSNRARRFHGSDIPETFYSERSENEVSIAASWELDIWGKLRSQKNMGAMAYLKSIEYQKAAKTSLISEIASTYFKLVLLKSQIDIYKHNLELNDYTWNIVQLQFNSGEVTSLAVKQTKSQKLRAQALIPQLEREYVQYENQLNWLVGRAPQHIDLNDVDLKITDEHQSAGMPLDLISNRPDMAEAEYNLKQSYEKVGVTNAMRYPSIKLGASTGLNAMNIDKLLDPLGSGFLLLNGLVVQPLFQKRKLKTNYEVALKEKEIAELEFKNSFINAMNEVSNAMVSISKLKEEYRIAQERDDLAKKAVKDANYLFKSGLANYLEVITAQRESLDSELNLENAKMKLFEADVQLYRSLGGGWD